MFLVHIFGLLHCFDAHPLHYLYSSGVQCIHFQILTGVGAPVAPVLNAALNYIDKVSKSPNPSKTTVLLEAIENWVGK